MNESPHILIIDDEQAVHREFELALLHHTHNPEVKVIVEPQSEDLLKPDMSKPHHGVEHALSSVVGIQKVKDALVKGNPFQVAFIEIGMLPMDGIETMERIWKIDPAVQVVLCTAPGVDTTDYDLESRIGRTGKVSLIKRPFDSIEVVQIAVTLSEKWILAKQAAIKNEQMEALVTQRSRRFIQRREYERLRELDRKSAAAESAQNGDSDPSAVVESDLSDKEADARFLHRTTEIVDAHMSDFDFDVGELAQKMFMSRRQLLRKLKDLTGCSPNVFIRSLRLKRAGQLLKTSKKTVSEITYAVGFADLKHFRAVFHEEFGVTPAKYGRTVKIASPATPSSKTDQAA